MDPLEAARAVFEQFQNRYKELQGRSRLWSLPIGNARLQIPGVTPQEKHAGLNVLLHKRLLKPMGVGSYCLTDLGEEACLHPELLDDYLAPRTMASVAAQSVTVHGGHVQIGSHNTQTITYRAILGEAIKAAEEREDVPAAIATALRRLYEYPDIDALMSDAATRAEKE